MLRPTAGRSSRHGRASAGTIAISCSRIRAASSSPNGRTGWSGSAAGRPTARPLELAWLRYLFVHPDAAGSGVGRQLVEVVEAAAGACGRTGFRVWSSLNAAGFYAAQGYRRVRQGRMPVTAAIEIDYVLLAKGA